MKRRAWFHSVRALSGVTLPFLLFSTAFAQQDPVSLLNSPDPDLRAYAIETLTDSGQTQHLLKILPLLRDPDPEVRYEAVWAVRDLGKGKHLDLLSERLGDSSKRVRAIAAGTIGKWAGAEHASAVARLLDDSELQVRTAAANALGRLGATDQAARVAGLLRETDPYGRLSAMLALAEMNATGYASRLVPHLNDPQTWLRYVAALHLGTLAGKSELAALEQTALDDGATAQGEALLSLARRGTRILSREEQNALASRLTPLLSSSDEQTRIQAVIALTRFGKTNTGEQRSALHTLTDPDSDLEDPTIAVELIDALTQMYEAPGYAKFAAERATTSALRSHEDLRRFFREAGLTLEIAPDVEIEAHVPNGVWITPQEAIDRITGSMYSVVVEGDRVSLQDPEEAADHWKQHLDRHRTGMLRRLRGMSE